VTQAKNIELALRVAAALKARSIRSKFIVTGPPDPHDQRNMEYFQGLLNLRDELGVEQEVRFIYQSGSSSETLVIDTSVVAELLRVSDALFMPSRREGFGMPILEAGLVGIPIFCADTIPAAREIAARNLVMFSPKASPDQVAGSILQTMESNPTHRLRRRVRQNLTWEKIFWHEILPLLEQGDS
jgi:glycosyltransferase involved in cell wall biosynthesis